MNNNQNFGSYAPAFAESRKKLKSLEAHEISYNSQSDFVEAESSFYIESFNQNFRITYPEGEIVNISTGQKPPLDWALILLNYLSGAKDLCLTEKLVSYRELPAGNVFFPSIKTYVLEVLGNFYGECDKTALIKALHNLGFVTLASKADLTILSYFTPRIPVQIQFWEGEEDIPSACQILFDSSIAQQLHIEDIAALCGIIRDTIIANYRLQLTEKE